MTYNGEILANDGAISCIGAFKMGARHSTKRELLSDTGCAAGDATPATTGKSSHRSSSSSAKLRARWSKVARSHSERSPARHSANRLNDGETSGMKNLQECSVDRVCSSVSAACQTQVQSVSVMTQTEFDDLLPWNMIDDDHCSCTSNSPTNHFCVVIEGSVDSSQKSTCITSVNSKRHSVNKDIVGRAMSNEAKSCSSEKETSSVICNGNHMIKHDCSTDVTVNPCTSVAKCLSSETDEGFVRKLELENFKPNRKTEELSSCIQRQTEKNTNVNAGGVSVVDKRKQSSLSEGRLMRGCERFDSGQSDHMICREDAVDFGSSFGSLSPGDMMLDTKVFDTPWSSNVRSCYDHSGYRIKHSNTGVISQWNDSIDGQHREYVQNESIDSPNHSKLAMISEDIQHVVNGSVGLDAVAESSSAVSSRYNVTCIIMCVTLFVLH